MHCSGVLLATSKPFSSARRASAPAPAPTQTMEFLILILNLFIFGKMI